MVDEGEREVVGEADWIRISDTDQLWSGPTELPPPLTDPAPALLNTHEINWDSFERLILAMARTLDGAYDVRRYGLPGQGQHGLDVVAFFSGHPPSVYQAKNWQTFGASDLEKAVRKYAEGRRPFGAKRIVVALGTEVRDTKTIEKLAALRTEYADLQVDLWDQQEISHRLRNQPQLVTTFFGPTTAAAFCSVTTSQVLSGAAGSVAADAILRGPVAHLGLVEDLSRALETVDPNPGDAADLLDRIADRLEASGFVPHAAPIRELQAKALRDANRRTEEARVRIDLGWLQLEAGDTFSAAMQVRELADWPDAPVEIVRWTNALSAAIGLRRDYAVTLDDLAEAFDELADDDPHRDDAALVLAEEAIAARLPEFVAVRASQLLQLAGGISQSDQGQLRAARLRMCVADSGGDWEGLAATARDTYAPATNALVLARSARHLGLAPAAQVSVARWRDAIEKACVEGLNDDAADWLYALRAVRLHSGLIGDDINDLHRHAQALRAAGTGTVIPEPYRARERGLAHFRDEKWPDAFEALRRYLWRSTVMADFSGEIDAHELLGELFARTGRVSDAIRHYVIAGQSKALEALAAKLEDKPVRLATDLITPRPWERAAAFSFAAASADLIVDEDATEWCSAALQEITDHSQPVPVFAPNPMLGAFKAFGQLALVSTEEQARQFIEIGSRLVPRDPKTYRFTDDDHVNALIGIARAHPALRRAAVDQLLAALLVDQRMADRVLRLGQDLLRDDPARTVAATAQAAAEGNMYAALAIVAAGDDVTQAVSLARDRLEAAIAPRVHQPGVKTFGTALREIGWLVSILPENDRVRFARGMLDFSNDQEESAYNRSDALLALANIARSLPNEARDALLDEVLPFATGDREASGEDPFFPRVADPLQRFRLSFGDAVLWPSGLSAAAGLAHTLEQYATVEDTAWAQLAGANDQATNSIAAALAALPADSLTLPVDFLAAHPNQWVRSLAAVAWAHRPDQPEQIGMRLAQDPSSHVRSSLARSLGDGDRDQSLRAQLGADPRRSVRRQVLKGPPEPTPP